MAMNKRKTTTAIVAGVTAAALLLGGTFAWTSISQQARNEAIVDINPGGRLHDDFNGTNKDVYVENFSSGATGVNIFARIRLDQYFEVGQDAGINKDVTDRKVNQILGTDINDETTWVTYTPGDLSDTSKVQANDNWQWNLGREMDEDGDGNNDLPYYMPTFNKNKDSLLADINGTYEGTTEGDIVHYDDYKTWADGDTVTQNATYDWDEDTEDEETPDSITDRNLPIDSADVLIESEEHTAAQISTGANVISMADWLALPAEEQIGDFWVYDTDGWAYWANYIAPGETTGLLLDSINMSRVPDDNYYYGINVVGQFATASDWTMLYESTDNGGGGSMTDNAMTLMELITATTTEDDNTLQVLELTADGSTDPVEINPGDSVKVVSYDENADMSAVKVSYPFDFTEEGEVIFTDLTEDQYSYDAATGELTILDESYSDTYKVTDATGAVYGYLSIYYESDGTTLTIGYVPSEVTERGYIMPGETLQLAASTSGDGTINSEDCTWSAYCGENHECYVSETGELQVANLGGVDEPHLITITCNYVNEEQGLNLTAEFHVVISDEDLNIAVKVKDAEGNIVGNDAVVTGTQYTLYTEVSTASNGVVAGFSDYHWDYSVTDANGGAAVSENQFMAFKPGEYKVSAWCSECLIGSHDPSVITASGESMSQYYVQSMVYNDELGDWEYPNVTVGYTGDIDIRSRMDNGEGPVPEFDSITAPDGITLTPPDYENDINYWSITANTVEAGTYTLTYTINAEPEYGILEDETGTIDLVIDAANA